MDSELHEAVEREHGKYSSIRVVHPMNTYVSGRTHGIYVGLMAGFTAAALHDIHFHDWHNIDAWHIAMLVIGVPSAIWMAYKVMPNKIAVEVRKSIDIYEDE